MTGLGLHPGLPEDTNDEDLYLLQADPREEIGNFPKEWRSLRCPFPNVCSAGLRTAVAINDVCPRLPFREQLSSRGQNP